MENGFKPQPFNESKFKPTYEKIEYTVDTEFQNKLDNIKSYTPDLSVEIFGYTISASRPEVNMNPREQLLNYNIGETRVKNNYILPEAKKWKGFNSFPEVESAWRHMCFDIISNITNIVKGHIDLSPLEVMNQIVLPILTEDELLAFPLLANELGEVAYIGEHTLDTKNEKRKDRRINRARYTVLPGGTSGSIMPGNTNLDIVMRSWASTNIKSVTHGLVNSFIANTITGTVHGLVNGLGALTDKIILMQKKNKLFFQLLNDGVFENTFIMDAQTISEFVKWYIDTNYFHKSDKNPNAEKIKKSKSIMTQYKSSKDIDARQRIILEALSYDPCNTSCYKKILHDFYADYMSNKAEIERLAKFCHVDLKEIITTLPKERMYNGEYCSSQEQYDALVQKCNKAKQVYCSEVQKLEEIYDTTDTSNILSVSKAIEMIDKYKDEFTEYTITNEAEYFKDILQSLDYNTPWNEFIRDFPSRKRLTLTEKSHFVSLLQETKSKASTEALPALTKELTNILNKKITNYNNGIESAKKSIKKDSDKICDIDMKITSNAIKIKIYYTILCILNLVVFSMLAFWFPAIIALLMSVIYHITGIFGNIISKVYPILHTSLIVGIIGTILYGITLLVSGQYRNSTARYRTLLKDREQSCEQIKTQQMSLEAVARNVDSDLYNEMISVFSTNDKLKEICSIESNINISEPSVITLPNEEKEGKYLGIGFLIGIILIIILIKQQF